MKINTTYSNTTKVSEITIESMREAIEKLENVDPIREKRYEMCKKHAKLLVKQCGTTAKKDFLMGGTIGELYGVPIKIRPYLKKIRVYTI
jgi:GMP synthase PP-ATPase subunit